MIAKLERAGHLMSILHRTLRRSYDKKLKEFDLTPCQFEVLMILLGEDGLLLSELGRRISRDGPTITGVIDRMEKKMLVKRKGDPRDRRVVRVVITPQGRNMEERLSTTKQQVLEKITKDLSTKEIAHLEAILVKMMRSVEESDFER